MRRKLRPGTAHIGNALIGECFVGISPGRAEAALRQDAIGGRLEQLAIQGDEILRDERALAIAVIAIIRGDARQVYDAFPCRVGDELTLGFVDPRAKLTEAIFQELAGVGSRIEPALESALDELGAPGVDDPLRESRIRARKFDLDEARKALGIDPEIFQQQITRLSDALGPGRRIALQPPALEPLACAL